AHLGALLRHSRLPHALRRERRVRVGDPQLFDPPAVTAGGGAQFETPELFVVLDELLCSDIDRRQLARGSARFGWRGFTHRRWDHDGFHPRNNLAAPLWVPVRVSIQFLARKRGTPQAALDYGIERELAEAATEQVQRIRLEIDATPIDACVASAIAHQGEPAVEIERLHASAYPYSVTLRLGGSPPEAHVTAGNDRAFALQAPVQLRAHYIAVGNAQSLLVLS